jgi:hypothetical protein
MHLAVKVFCLSHLAVALLAGSAPPPAASGGAPASSAASAASNSLGTVACQRQTPASIHKFAATIRCPCAVNTTTW